MGKEAEQPNEIRDGHRHHSHGKHRKRRKKSKNKALQLTVVIILCLIILACMAVATVFVIRNMGAKNLKNQATTIAPVMTMEEPETQTQTEETDILQEGQIMYQGQKYQYNDDLRTFVIMGIDTMDTVEDLIASPINGGQSDMNFLAMLNPHTKKIQMIAINRNLMTNIHEYTADGTYVDTKLGQLTLQHAYGSGGADSCEMMVSAIDNIMYMVPIHGYFAMNMGAIAKLNDAIGGVELTALEDVVEKGTNIRKGEKVTLLGQDAFWYTKYRDWKVDYSADARLERQKQYLSAFVNKTKSMIKNDLSIPLDLYNIIAKYSVTDISVDEMTYLASIAVGYSFNTNDIYSIPGETVTEGLEYEEFYPDEAALYDLVVELFYEPVED